MKLDKIQIQRRNANTHTEHGMRKLETSIQQDGPIGAISAAANGEIFAGSARREIFESLGIEDAIIVHSDGTKPVILIRDDIPDADDPRAIRLGLADNKIAADNLSWDATLLAEIQAQDATLLAGLFSDMELETLIESVSFDIDSEQSSTRIDLSHDVPVVWFMVAVSDVTAVEQAIQATGLINRGDALIEICGAYLATR